MFAKSVRTAIVGAAGVALSLAVATGSAQAAPVASGAPAVSSAGQSAATSSRVYLGRVAEGGDHNYSVNVSAGTYTVEYVASYAVVENTYVDASKPHIVPLPDGLYLGQTTATATKPGDTPTFTLTAGVHKITSQAVWLYGTSDVYLVKK